RCPDHPRPPSRRAPTRADASRHGTTQPQRAATPSRRSPPPRLHAGSTLIDPCRVDLSVTLQVEAPPPRPAPPPSRAGGHDGPPNAVARHGAHIGAGIGQPLQGVGSAAEEVEERSRLRDRAPHDADRLAARSRQNPCASMPRATLNLLRLLATARGDASTDETGLGNDAT